jgi:hypothetical protein
MFGKIASPDCVKSEMSRVTSLFLFYFSNFFSFLFLFLHSFIRSLIRSQAAHMIRHLASVAARQEPEVRQQCWGVTSTGGRRSRRRSGARAPSASSTPRSRRPTSCLYCIGGLYAGALLRRPPEGPRGNRMESGRRSGGI